MGGWLAGSTPDWGGRASQGGVATVHVIVTGRSGCSGRLAFIYIDCEFSIIIPIL